MDWFPTVLDLCGVQQLSGSPKLDGHSVLPLIRNAKAKSKNKILHFAWGKKWAVRESDWKLIGSDGNTKVSLRNLADAKPEARDYAKAKPEIVWRLRKLHNDWVEEVSPK
jgi:arylsulfatase A-like enzyme